MFTYFPYSWISRNFLEFFSFPENYPEMIRISWNSGNFLQSGNTACATLTGQGFMWKYDRSIMGWSVIHWENVLGIVVLVGNGWTFLVGVLLGIVVLLGKSSTEVSLVGSGLRDSGPGGCNSLAEVLSINIKGILESSPIIKVFFKSSRLFPETDDQASGTNRHQELCGDDGGSSRGTWLLLSLSHPVCVPFYR